MQKRLTLVRVWASGLLAWGALRPTVAGLEWLPGLEATWALLALSAGLALLWWPPASRGALTSLALLLPALPLGAALMNGEPLALAWPDALALGSAVALAWGIARALEALERDAAPDSRESGQAFVEALYGSVLRARRYSRPLALLAIEPVEPTADTVRAADEVAALLQRSTRDCDRVAGNGECVLAAFPEIGRAEVQSLISRIESLVGAQLGLEVRVGSASFPEDAITSEALLERAFESLAAATSASPRPEPRAAEADRPVPAAGSVQRPGGQDARPPVAYLLSRFPKLTETFVLNEILAMERLGIEVSLHPLRRERAGVMHPEAAALTDRADFSALLSPAILRSNLRAIATRPGVWLRTLATVLRCNLGSLRYLAGAVAFFPRAVHLAYQLSDAGVRHVHAHFASHPAMVAFVIRRMAGIPYSFTAHGSDLHRDRHMLREKVREAAFVVAISQYNRRVILDCCGDEWADRVIVIHCGVDPGTFRPAKPKSPDAPTDPPSPPRIVCLGSLHAVKGQAHLIEACRILSERGLAFECNLIGDGPDRRALEARAATAGLADRFHFLGQLPRPEVAERLRGAALAVAPSVPTRDGRREGIPVALMEACASGLPVVASRLSGIPELVEDGRTGFLVEPGDAVGLADTIERLLRNDELRRELGDAGRERVEKGFHLEANAAALASLFVRGTP